MNKKAQRVLEYDKIIEKFLPYFQKNGTFALIYIF